MLRSMREELLVRQRQEIHPQDLLLEDLRPLCLWQMAHLQMALLQQMQMLEVVTW